METTNLPTLKDRLYWARRRGDLTKKEVATRAGLSQTVYLKLERGDNKTTGRIVQLAQALGVNPAWLATGKGDPLDNSLQIAKIDIESPLHLSHNPQPPLKKWTEVIADKGGCLEVFSFKFEGDTMVGGKPTDIPHGAIIDIDPSQAGAVGAVHLASVGGFPAVGVLQQHGPNMFLKPNNAAYPAWSVVQQELIGVVVGYRVQFSV